MDVYKEWLGIPESARPPDHYTLLRLVQFEDDDEKIRRNYTKLNEHVRKYATGQYSIQSQELLNELAKAMLCLTDKERKLEYDAGQGREPDKQSGTIERQSLAEVLISEERISADQAREAESFADARGLSMRDAVVQLKLVDADVATRAFATELGYSFVDLSSTVPDDSVLDKVPRNLVKRYSVLPLFIDDDVLLVACIHDPTPDLEDEMRLRYGVPMRPVMATPLAVNQGISKFYAPGMRDDAKDDESSAAKKKADGKSAKTKKPAKTRAAATDDDEADPYQKRLIGILIMCWTLIGCVLLDQYVLRKLVFTTGNWPFYSTLLLPPAVIFWVLKIYWK